MSTVPTRLSTTSPHPPFSAAPLGKAGGWRGRPSPAPPHRLRAPVTGAAGALGRVLDRDRLEGGVDVHRDAGSVGPASCGPRTSPCRRRPSRRDRRWPPRPWPSHAAATLARVAPVRGVLSPRPPWSAASGIAPGCGRRGPRRRHRDGRRRAIRLCLLHHHNVPRGAAIVCEGALDGGAARRSGCGSSSCSTTLLPMLESDLSYARFLLDGQTAVLDDYLEIRPEAEPRSRASRQRAARGRPVDGADGRVHGVGRDDGARPPARHRARRRVRRRDAGRLPARHVRPRRADAADAPARRPRARGRVARCAAAVEQTAFWWEAPDGLRVRAEYLYGSYSNGRDLPDDAKRLVARARDYEAEFGSGRSAML